MIGRMGRPGLIGTAARTAVIVGTASATNNALERRRQNKADQEYEAQQYAAQQQQAQYQEAARQAAAQYQPGSTGSPAPAAEDALLDRLQQLAQLHAQGVLTDAEFASAKAKLIG